MKASVASRDNWNISFFPILNSQTGSPLQRLVSLPNVPVLLLSSIKNSTSISTARRIHKTFLSCSGDGNAIGRESPAKALRGILGSPGIHLGPACFDALSAKLVERAGFDFCFTTGFGISAARLGLPDTGLISYGEMVDQGKQITQAVSIPIIGDGDNGYGNAMNVKRTVNGYIGAGFAGIILEDQVSPKACGHTQGRKVVSREEAVMKLKAAVDARKESGSDIVIVARTDSRQAVSFEESIWRSRALADAGADVLFIDALASKEEMKAFCEVYPLVPKMVSPTAYGHTPGRKVVSREKAVMKLKAPVDAQKESGSDIVIVAQTDSRQAVSFEDSIWGLWVLADAGADVLFIDALASKEEMKAFCEVYPLVPKMVYELMYIPNNLANMLEGGGKTPILNPIDLEDLGYKLVAYPLSLLGVSIRAMQDALTAIRGGRIPPPGSMPSFEEIKEILGFNTYYEEERRYVSSTRQLSSQRASNAYRIEQEAQENVEQIGQSPQDPVVEVITPEVYNNFGADGSRSPFSGIWSRTLRVKITGRDGFERLDVRIPAGFLDGLTNIVPALGGVNIKSLLDDAASEVGGKLLLDFNDTVGDRIQVFLE